MAKKRNVEGPVQFLQGSVAAFFVLVGLATIVNYNSDAARFGRAIVRAFGGSNDPISLVIAILSVAAGVILIAGLLVRVKTNVMYATGLGVLVFWLLRIIYLYFANDAFKPDLLIWLEQLSPDVVVLAALWLVTRRYA